VAERFFSCYPRLSSKRGRPLSSPHVSPPHYSLVVIESLPSSIHGDLRSSPHLPPTMPFMRRSTWLSSDLDVSGRHLEIDTVVSSLSARPPPHPSSLHLQLRPRSMFGCWRQGSRLCPANVVLGACAREASKGYAIDAGSGETYTA
jgi:hypothetical protein